VKASCEKRSAPTVSNTQPQTPPTFGRSMNGLTKARFVRLLDNHVIFDHQADRLGRAMVRC
jgi:hypothetical protein